MTTYEVLDWQGNGLPFGYTQNPQFSSLAEAADANSYPVAVENGIMRALTPEEEAQYQAARTKFSNAIG